MMPRLDAETEVTSKDVSILHSHLVNLVAVTEKITRRVKAEEYYNLDSIIQERELWINKIEQWHLTFGSLVEGAVQFDNEEINIVRGQLETSSQRMQATMVEKSQELFAMVVSLQQHRFYQQ